MRHVEVSGDCLVWTGKKAGRPGYQYGQFAPGTRSTDPKVYSHRWIWEQLVGPIPDGMQVDHVRNRGCLGYLCVKISHLEVVTGDENMRRARLELCRAGRHDLTDTRNVRWDQQGRRRGCAPCHSEKALARYYANKGKS